MAKKPQFRKEKKLGCGECYLWVKDKPSFILLIFPLCYYKSVMQSYVVPKARAMYSGTEQRLPSKSVEEIKNYS
jgi:hypothetical protein